MIANLAFAVASTRPWPRRFSDRPRNVNPIFPNLASLKEAAPGNFSVKGCAVQLEGGWMHDRIRASMEGPGRTLRVFASARHRAAGRRRSVLAAIVRLLRPYSASVNLRDTYRQRQTILSWASLRQNRYEVAIASYEIPACSNIQASILSCHIRSKSKGRRR